MISCTVAGINLADHGFGKWNTFHSGHHDLNEAFNQMTDRVRQMMDDRERLLADVSHELRSPLARIKVALELLPEGEATV